MERKALFVWLMAVLSSVVLVMGCAKKTETTTQNIQIKQSKIIAGMPVHEQDYQVREVQSLKITKP
ncbi:MAG: NF038215 family lipoprotein [Acinetobacter sp.]